MAVTITSSKPSPSKSSTTLAPESSFTARPAGPATSGEAFDVVIRIENGRRNEPAGGNFGWIIADGHGSDIEEPAAGEVVREFGEEIGEDADGVPGTIGPEMDSATLEGEEAGIGVVIAQAIALLSHAQIAESLVEPKVNLIGRRTECRGRATQQFDVVEGVQGLLVFARVQELGGKIKHELAGVRKRRISSDS